jgi:hypothetical protein
MNKAMGVKLLWRLVIGHTTWWKKSLSKKIFHRFKDSLFR